jgi:hypothetical protein
MFFTILIGIFLRLLYLDEIPAEMWGDVNEHYFFTQNILNGNFNFNYWGGDGPMFDYFSALISKFGGLSFYSLKLTTVIIGTLLIVVNYLVAKEYFKNKKIGLIVAFLTAVSFWSLTFSRQAKPYILVPLVTSLTILFYLRKKYFLSGLIIGIGTYTQSSFWGMFFFSFLDWKMFLGAFLLSSKLFFDFYTDKTMLFDQTSYLGEKLIGSLNQGILTFIGGVIRNYLINLRALFYQGDGVFRHNIPFQPHLDSITAIFFVIGLFLIIKEVIIEKKYNHFLIFYTGFLCLIPTSIDIHNQLNNPSMGRTVSLTLIIFLFTAYAIYKVVKNRLIIFFVLILIFFSQFLSLFFYISENFTQ